MMLKSFSLGLLFLLQQGNFIYDSFHSPPLPFGHLHFVDLSHGWLISSMGPYRTADGGGSWVRMPKCGDDSKYGPGFVPESSFLAWEDASRAIVRTASGVSIVDETGCRPVQVPTKGPLFFLDLRFYDERAGWGSSGNDGVYRTIDGGRNWTRLAMARPPVALLPMSASEVWGTSGGTLLHTTDGGVTWKTILDLPFGGTSRVCMLVRGSGWWLGVGFLYKTDDGGKTWSPLPWNTYGDVSFGQDGIEGWIVGDFGRVFHSQDGGKTWERQQCGTKEDLGQVQVLSDGHAWIWARNGTVHRTVNHGRTWARVVIQ
jgi:photosystem II stability/assembly factor-like uncharacterized protein